MKQFKDTVLPLTVCALLLLLLSPTSHAGQEKGGGDVIVCKDQVYLADTYSLTKSAFSQLNMISFDQQKLRKILIKIVEIETPSLAKKVQHLLLTGLKFRWSPLPLPELNDDDIRFWSFHCHKRQLAIQNRETGDVMVDQVLYDQLSSLEKELLYIHEAYISLLQVGKNTKPIRAIVKRLLQNANYLEQLFSHSKVLDMELAFSLALVQTIGFVPKSLQEKKQSVEEFAEHLIAYKWKLVQDWSHDTFGSASSFVSNNSGNHFLNLLEKYFNRANICRYWDDRKNINTYHVLSQLDGDDDLLRAMTQFATAHCSSQ